MRANQADDTPHSRKATFARFAAIVISLLMVSVFIIGQSRAAFTATTDNTGNGFSAAAIELTDNDGDPATAMFNVSNMLPGQSVEGCIRVTYTGSVATNGVKVYRGAYSDSGTFAEHLDIQIEEETTAPGTAFNNCTGFVGTPVTGLTTIAAMPTTFGSGVGTWTPTTTSSKWYKFTVTLGTDTPADQNGESVSALPFVWETRAGA